MSRARSLRSSRLTRGLCALPLLTLAVFAAGCGTAGTVLRNERVPSPSVRSKILIMPPGVNVYEANVGMTELRADWTSSASSELVDILASGLQRDGRGAVIFRPPSDDERQRTYFQLVRVGWLTARAIRFHSFARMNNMHFHLPTKGDGLEWTLGDGVRVLRDDHDGADFALFTSFQSTHATFGRLFVDGVARRGTPRGQGTVAWLMDLRSGDIVWLMFKEDPSGDLRSREGTVKAVQELLSELPR